jgi:hypothetical protein
MFVELKRVYDIGFPVVIGRVPAAVRKNRFDSIMTSYVTAVIVEIIGKHVADKSKSTILSRTLASKVKSCWTVYNLSNIRSVG